MDDSTPSPGRSHVYLVDGSGFIFRAFHALPGMNRSDGTPTNAVFGFTTMLIKLIEDLGADHCAVIFDTARVSFRNAIFPEYKAQRPDPPEELIPQFGLIRDAVRAFNVACVELEGFEADDIIATYTTQAVARDAQVTIVSSDKDLMQLVGHGVTMFDPMRNRDIGIPEVTEKFGVGPDRVIDVQALAGDSVDNVPGVPGIGVKTAALLINEYGDLETLLASAENIKQPKRRQNLQDYAEQARISRELVTLRRDVEGVPPLEELAVRPPDPERILAFLREQEFRRLIPRFERDSVDRGAPAEDGSALDAAGYVLVQDAATLERWIGLARHRGVVAFDTETSSLNAVRAELIGVSLAVAPGEACYVPLRHAAGTLLEAETSPGPQIPFDTALDLLKPLLEDPGVLKIGHNIKYDSLVMRHPRNGGVSVAPVDDTMCLSYVLGAGRHGHGLDELARLHFDHTTIKYEEVCGKGKAQIGFAQVGLEQACRYAAEDADVSYRLHRTLKTDLPRSAMTVVYETLERPLIPVLVQMEAHGIRVDPDVLRAMSADFAHRLKQAEADIHDLAGQPFNVGSPRQLGDILFGRMGLPGGRKTRTGAYATDATVLEDLAAEGNELPARVLDWRQLAKLKSTYTDALVDEINGETGRIHTSYSMTGASTGRLSSNDPNLQNIPIRTDEGRKIRTAFIAEPGHVLLSVDYSQIELRLLAHIAGIDSLREAFLDGIDIHAQTASRVFGVPLQGMDPMVRRKAKAINFGIIYGISSYGLARQLRCPQREAREYIDAYFERFPGIRTYMDQARQTAREQGFVQTLFGRRVHVTGIRDANRARRAFSERAAINAPIQGSAADIIKRAMVRIPGRLHAAGLGARMLLQVHDELLFEVPEDEVEQTTSVVRRTMEGAALPAVDLSVPLIADAGSGGTWADAH